jgi:galactonate dehydratase
MTTRGSIRITGIKSYLFHPFTSNSNWTIQKHWAFVKIETDQGIEGWGEAFTVKGREQNIIQYFTALTPYLLGKNPFQIKQFTQLVYSNFAERRGGVDLFSAVSGIEQALWDIVGKNLKTPVYNLLGGALSR